MRICQSSGSGKSPAFPVSDWPAFTSPILHVPGTFCSLADWWRHLRMLAKLPYKDIPVVKRPLREVALWKSHDADADRRPLLPALSAGGRGGGGVICTPYLELSAGTTRLPSRIATEVKLHPKLLKNIWKHSLTSFCALNTKHINASLNKNDTNESWQTKLESDYILTFASYLSTVFYSRTYLL